MDKEIAVLIAAAMLPLVTLAMFIVTRKDKASEAGDARLKALNDGMRMLLVYRCRRLAKKAVDDGSIDVDLLATVRGMADAAHALGANGEISACVQAVEKLPIKREE